MLGAEGGPDAFFAGRVMLALCREVGPTPTQFIWFCVCSCYRFMSRTGDKMYALFGCFTF